VIERNVKVRFYVVDDVCGRLRESFDTLRDAQEFVKFQYGPDDKCDIGLDSDWFSNVDIEAEIVAWNLLNTKEEKLTVEFNE
jgi:hypothetical protein